LDLAVYSPVDVSLENGRSVEALVVSERYFGVLGIAAFTGTLIPGAGGDDVRDGVVVSRRLWRDVGFDQGGDVAGSLALNGVQVPIVGVADAGFGGLEPPPADVWIFLSTAARLPGVSHIVDNRSSQFGWSVIGQRRPGVSDQLLEQG